jgi:hypothetical protein
LFGACVRADAATLFTALGVLGLLSSLLAFDATDDDVRSLLAMPLHHLSIAEDTPPVSGSWEVA